MAAIELDSLRKEYRDVVAVDDLSFTVEEGELFSLLGVNGAGKTTTIKMLSTLIPPTGGDAVILGKSLRREASEIKGLIDVSTQETAVARKLTVEENLRFYAALNGLSKGEIDERVEEAYRVFGLDSVAKKQAAKLSGGWQRKLSIALALVNRPKILFLDEPTLGLDVIARRELWRAISSLKGSMTIILTTHYMEEAEALSDRIGIINRGKLMFVGTKEELYVRTGKTSVEDAFVEVVSGGESNA
ncbi:MAG: ABC transporter ATP-binding protein [Clostridia bacterium]|nr:ABC transporter ATP-binding protein [Clostridia bacterium]